MGIFDNISKRREEAQARRIEQQEKERAEEEKLKYKIAHSPFIDALFDEFNKQDWILRRQSGKDNGSRSLCISSDTIEVKWSEWRNEPRIVGQNRLGINKYEDHFTEEIYGQIVISFTKSGYKPLADTDFMTKRLFADVIIERIESQIPGTHSQPHHGGHKKLYSENRTYYLPEPTNTLF